MSCSAARKNAFDHYARHWQRVQRGATLQLCDGTPAAKEARQVLLSHPSEVEKSSAFPLYATVSQCLRDSGKSCRQVLGALVKATELLEMFSVNVFLYPWRKEIKTLKTFTGPFVYNIQSALPELVTRGILESIGYLLEKDTEYVLSEKPDSERTIQVGFELFLARQECKYLLEVMAHKPDGECWEILQRRAADDGKEAVSILGETEELRALSNGGSDGQDRPQSLESEEAPEGTAPCNYSTDANDQSLLEMKIKYPDLALNHKPVFGNKRGPGNQEICFHGNGLQAEELKPEAFTGSESQQPLPLKVKPKDTVDELVTRFDKLRVEEPGSGSDQLKYPVEETTRPAVCHHNEFTGGVPAPKQDTIKEPPSSFYIPPMGHDG